MSVSRACPGSEHLPASMISHSTSPAVPSGKKRLTSPIMGQDAIASGTMTRSVSGPSNGVRARRMKVNSSKHQYFYSRFTDCRHLPATSLSRQPNRTSPRGRRHCYSQLTHSASLALLRWSRAPTLLTLGARVTSSTRGTATRQHDSNIAARKPYIYVFGPGQIRKVTSSLNRPIRHQNDLVAANDCVFIHAHNVLGSSLVS